LGAGIEEELTDATGILWEWQQNNLVARIRPQVVA
jgi:hypothetical protein